MPESMLLKESDLDLENEASLVNRAIRESVESAERTRQAMEDAILDQTWETLQETEQKLDLSFKTTLGSLAEEASSELVQKELEAMSKIDLDLTENTMEEGSSLSSTITNLVKKFAHIDLSRDTRKEDLNMFLSRLPKTNGVKG